MNSVEALGWSVHEHRIAEGWPRRDAAWLEALAGAAGFHIGWATAFPGEQSRLDAAAAAGRRAGALMGGVLVMLLCAGLLEGLGRQLIQSDAARYAIAGTTAVLWPAYLYAFRGPRTRLERAGG